MTKTQKRLCQCISRSCLKTAPSNRTLVDCSTSCSALNSVCQSCRILQGNLIVLEPDPASPAVVAIRDLQEEAFVHAYKDETTFQKMVSGAIFDELLLNRTADLIDDIVDCDAEDNYAPIDVDEDEESPIDIDAEDNYAPIDVDEDEESPIDIDAEDDYAPIDAEADYTPVNVDGDEESPIDVDEYNSAQVDLYAEPECSNSESALPTVDQTEIESALSSEPPTTASTEVESIVSSVTDHSDVQGIGKCLIATQEVSETAAVAAPMSTRFLTVTNIAKETVRLSCYEGTPSSCVRQFALKKWSAGNIFAKSNSRFYLELDSNDKPRKNSVPFRWIPGDLLIVGRQHFISQTRLVDHNGVPSKFVLVRVFMSMCPAPVYGFAVCDTDLLEANPNGAFEIFKYKTRKPSLCTLKFLTLINIESNSDLSLYHCSTRHPYNTDMVEEGYESFLDNANLRYDPTRRKLKCDTEWAIAQQNTSDLDVEHLNTAAQIQDSYELYLKTDEEILNAKENPLPPRKATRRKAEPSIAEPLATQKLIDAQAQLRKLSTEAKAAQQNAEKQKKALERLTTKQTKDNEKLAKQLADAKEKLKKLECVDSSTSASLIPVKAAKTSAVKRNAGLNSILFLFLLWLISKSSSWFEY
jgi:hypothetical protein